MASSEFEYSFRLSFFGRERNYRLAPNMLEWSGKTSGGKLRYADIRKVRLCTVRALPLFRRRRPPGWRCVLFTCANRKIVLASDHYASFAVREDRRQSFLRFANELIARISAQNPQVVWQNDLYRRGRLDALSAT